MSINIILILYFFIYLLFTVVYTLHEKDLGQKMFCYTVFKCLQKVHNLIELTVYTTYVHGYNYIVFKCSQRKSLLTKVIFFTVLVGMIILNVIEQIMSIDCQERGVNDWNYEKILSMKTIYRCSFP